MSFILEAYQKEISMTTNTNGDKGGYRINISKRTRELLINAAYYNDKIEIIKGYQQSISNKSRNLVFYFETDEHFPENIIINDLKRFNEILMLMGDPDLYFYQNEILIRKGRRIIRFSIETHINELKTVDPGSAIDELIISCENLKKLISLARLVKSPKKRKNRIFSGVCDYPDIRFFSESGSVFASISQESEDKRIEGIIYLQEGIINEVKAKVSLFKPMAGAYRLTAFNKMICLYSEKYKTKAYMTRSDQI